MEHLFASVAQVQRLQRAFVNGLAVVDYVDLMGPLSYMRCRLDLGFLRPGRDAPAPQEGPGTAMNRFGLLLCMPDVGGLLKAGDRLKMIPNDFGDTVISGYFELGSIPDVAQAYNSGHHIEVQVSETGQDLAGKISGVTP